MTALSQRDPKWANLILGFNASGSIYTIGAYGCLITCIAMVVGLTPDVVNDKLKAVNGFSAGNGLLLWPKVKEALPIDLPGWVAPFDNDAVLREIAENGFCIVWVDFDGQISSTNDMHWVLYIGNQQLIDPWTGVIKGTSNYPLVKGYAPCKKTIVATPQPVLPPWLSNFLTEKAVDLSQAESKIREVWDEADKYEVAQKDRDKALRDLAEARGDAVKYEELYLTATNENTRLSDEIADLRKASQTRDTQISTLQARVDALESQLDPKKVIILSKEEYAVLIAKDQIQAASSIQLLKAVIRKLFKK